MLRIGILGAARIAPAAVIAPARRCPGVAVTAVAARDGARAEAFAARHGLARAHGSYEALLADPDVDAVYIPLPNGLHGRWLLAALDAGKHVLCEKPFAANAEEAERMARAADASGRTVMEAFHYRYHPLAHRIAEIVAGGELGPLRHIESRMCFPLPLFGDIRYRYDLAGGAMMDAGCYAVHWARLVAGTPEVTAAQARLKGEAVDRAMEVELRFPGGATGRVRVSMWSRHLLDISLRVIGERGEMRVINPVMPQAWHRLTVRSGGRRRVETLTRRPTYLYQLEAFAEACRSGGPVLTPAADAVATLQVIDAAYRAAGLPLRRPAAELGP
jgi:predicted dehydrogenase